MTATAPAPQVRPKRSIHLSHSQLRTYASCSLQWFFSRRYRPAFVSSALVFGSAFHKGMQAYYQGLLEGRTIGATEMQAAFLEHWEEEAAEIRFGKKEDPAALPKTAEAMYQAFLAEETPGEVVAVEEPFECHLADGLPKLVGYIDLVEVREDEGERRLHLIDFKTTSRKPSGPDDVEADQLTLYAIGAHRTGLLAQFNMPFVLDYLIVTKAKSPQVIRITVEPDRHEALRLIEKARVCWRGMSEAICFPTPSWMCAGCGYQEMCKRWPEVPTRKEA